MRKLPGEKIGSSTPRVFVGGNQMKKGQNRNGRRESKDKTKRGLTEGSDESSVVQRVSKQEEEDVSPHVSPE